MRNDGYVTLIIEGGFADVSIIRSVGRSRRRSSHRTFGTNEWQELSQRLGTWRQSVDNVLDVIRNAKLLTEQQRSLAA